MHDAVPTLEPGVTLVRTPEARSPAVHDLAVSALADVAGRTLWVDARNVASTYALYERAPSRRRLDHVRVARAFTAYQHHALVRRVVRAADARLGLVVAPNVLSLYRDDDLPAYEREALATATVSTLAELAAALDVPVLLSTAREGDALDDLLVDHADREIECERTQFGYRYDGDGVETDVYWCRGYWQTTIPYWVDLLGTATDGVAPAAPDRDPVGV